MLLRQEHHADAVFAGGRQLDPLARHLGAVVVVRNLDQDAGAVAHQPVGSDRAALVEVLEDLQTLLDDRVRLAPRDVGHETDAAGIVLVRGRVQTRRRRRVDFLLRGRRPVLDLAHDVPRLCHPKAKNTAAQQFDCAGRPQ